MGQKKKKASKPGLRERAENRVRQKVEALSRRPGMDREHLEHELQIHQIELEMQNEQLRRAQEELERSRAKYFDLFDLAPVGYFTLGARNLLIEANLAGAALLGVERRHMAGRRFTRFITRDTQDVFYLAWRKALETKDSQMCELKMQRNDNSPIWVQLTISATQDQDGNFRDLRIAVTDITDRKLAETKVREYQAKLKEMAGRILAVQEQERKRIAIGLHDNVAQKIVLAKLGVESALPSISNPVVAASLKNVAEMIGGVIRDAESLTFELSDPLLRELGFVPALRRYLDEEFWDKYKTSCEFRADDDSQELSIETRLQLFRIVRELLTNVGRHAQARHVTVSVVSSDGQMRVSVDDDGVGFDTGRLGRFFSEGGGFGLFSVKEQLEQVGGSCAIRSEPGRGTSATVTVPLLSN